MLDAGTRVRLAAQIDHGGVMHEALRQALDRRRQRRREHHGAPVLGQLLEDVLDLGQETEVEHVIGLVEHQVLDAVESQVAATDVVEQPPWRCDHQLGAAVLEGVDLPLHADATDERSAAQAHLVAHHRHELGRLQSDLAGGTNDERLHAVLGLDHVEKRKHERRRLAGAGLGQPDQIAAVEGDRDHRALDRRRPQQADLLHGADQLGRKPQLAKVLRAVLR